MGGYYRPVTESAGKLERIGRLLIRELDLLVLVVAAAAAVLLELFGQLSGDRMSSVILALLAMMELSQIRLREQMTKVAQASHAGPLDRLLNEYPPDLERRRAAAKDVLLIGNALRRTSKSYARWIGSSITTGARVRVLLPDPGYIKKMGRVTLAREIEESIRTLRENVPQGMEASLEIGVMKGFPPANFNVLDAESADGSVVVGYHEFAPLGEAAPILDLRASDAQWFARLRDQAYRLGRPVPCGHRPCHRLVHVGMGKERSADLCKTRAAGSVSE